MAKSGCSKFWGLVILLFWSVLVQATDSVPVVAKTQVQWLGHAATLITTPGGKKILIDPFITNNPAVPAKYRQLDALGHVDLILVTHAHFDHLGDAPELAKRLKIPLIAPPGLSQTLIDLGIMPVDLLPMMNVSGTLTPFHDGVHITMVHAEHSSELEWENPVSHHKELHPAGTAVGYIIEMENGFKIYHMGDTGLFGDMKSIADYYRPDLMMIPIGGRFTMDPLDAAFAVRYWLHPRFVIPIHYGTFPSLTGTPEEFTHAIGPNRVKVMVLKPGESASF